ncbi:uncharacterized protein M421DRAFT_45816, partial [Didymella exigua CBS 183.55]
MRLPLELLLLCAGALSAPLAPRAASFAHLAGLTTNTRDLSTTDSRSPQKYFHESILHPHYDGRFATTVLPRDTRLLHMRLLLRSYTLAMARARVSTWLMHGSLLGWWWNGGVFPWDSDLDFSVEERGMRELGLWWNMTVHAFSAAELGVDSGLADGSGFRGGAESTGERRGGAGGMDWRGRAGGMDWMREPAGLQAGTWAKVVAEGKRYLLEVNPHFTDTSTRDKHNRIDARWIDTSTGLFIDITTVHPVPSPLPDAARRSHKFVLKEPAAHTTHQDQTHMYTKDTHLYATASLFPLRESSFEGTPISVPYAYEQLLLEEYGPRALTETWFDGYRFDAATKAW